MPSLREALLSPETTLTVSFGERQTLTLRTPSFGPGGSQLKLQTEGSAEAGRIKVVVANQRGEVSAEFLARTGQPPFPEGSYTITVTVVPGEGVEPARGPNRIAEEKGPLVLRGRPRFDPLEPEQEIQVQEMAIEMTDLGLRDDVLEVRELGADLALLPLRRAGIRADWVVSPTTPPDKPSLWWLIFRCGAMAVACVLGAIAAAPTGILIGAALAGCAVAGGDCGELLGKYLDP